MQTEAACLSLPPRFSRHRDLFGLQGGQRTQDFFDMSLYLDLGKDFLDVRILPDDEGSALNSHDRLAVHVFFFVDAIGREHILVRIRQQRHVQIILFAKFLLLADVVGADAEDDGIRFIELIDRIPEPGCFAGSAWCVGLRVKKQHHSLFAHEIGEANFPAVIIPE